MGFLALLARCLTTIILSILIVTAPVVVAQDVMPNPMLRPQAYADWNKKKKDPEQSSEQSTEQSSNSEPAEPDSNTVNPGLSESAPNAGLALQPTSSSNAEELALEQQKLNSARVPLPLSSVFTGMELVGHYNSNIILRFQASGSRQSGDSASGGASGGSSSGGSGGGSSSGGSVPLPVVLQFKTGAETQLYGYTLRVREISGNVTFEWYSEQEQAWINVFNTKLEGGLQSASIPQTLETLKTTEFDYLKPGSSSGGFSSSSETTSSSTTGN